ncbi:MAG: hypothetical protein ACYDCN_13965 [Bacteroidia bacterium]
MFSRFVGMKHLLIIVISLLTINFYGQFAGRITNYSKAKDFINLISLIDSLHETGQRRGINYSAYVEYNRQIINKNYETILNYEESEPYVIEYTIKLISDSNTIIYCKMTRVEFKDKSEIVYHFIDKEKFSSLQKQYKKTYDRRVHIKDFFEGEDNDDDKIVYGKRCGRAAIPPKYREICEKAIEKKNINLLNKWLTSVTTEKQMYALEAFLRLEKSGLILSVKQKTLIDIIKNKTGTIRCCGGCIYSRRDIQDVLEVILK